MRTIRPMVMSLLILAGCAAGTKPTISGPPTTSSEYQPLEVGWCWTFEIEGGGTCRRVVSSLENVGRYACRVIEETAGEHRLRWWVRSDREGLRLYRFSDGTVRQDLDDPAVWFKYPPSRGEKWEYEVQHGVVDIHCYAVYEDDERIRVPAGEFMCARIRTFGFCERTEVFEKVEWYARGIGLVRQTVKHYDGRKAAMNLREIGR